MYLFGASELNRR